MVKTTKGWVDEKPSTPLKFARFGVVRMSRGKLFPSLNRNSFFVRLFVWVSLIRRIFAENIFWTLFFLPSIYPMWLVHTQETLRDNNNRHRRYLNYVQSSRSFARIVKLKAVPSCIKMIINCNKSIRWLFKADSKRNIQHNNGKKKFLDETIEMKETVEETCKDESAIAKLKQHEPSNNNNNMMNMLRKKKNCIYANCYKPSSCACDCVCLSYNYNHGDS